MQKRENRDKKYVILKAQSSVQPSTIITLKSINWNESVWNEIYLTESPLVVYTNMLHLQMNCNEW